MTQIRSLDALRALYPPARERSVLKQLPELDTHARRFIALSPFVVVASGGVDGLDASPRGGAPGFVKAPDAHTLLIPDSPGNNRLDTLQNLLREPALGLLFLVPGVDETLRVNGTAELCTDEDLREACRDQRRAGPPQASAGRSPQGEGHPVLGRVPALVIRVAVQACYLHCAKALMRSELWNPALHQPRSCMPSMGEMMRDQMADRVSPGTVFETQEQMLERYRQTL